MYLGVRQTRQIGKQYLVKWRGCHHKESQWVKPRRLDHLLEIVEKFKLKKDPQNRDEDYNEQAQKS
jgi:hypothetical protein